MRDIAYAFAWLALAFAAIEALGHLAQYAILWTSLTLGGI